MSSSKVSSHGSLAELSPFCVFDFLLPESPRRGRYRFFFYISSSELIRFVDSYAALDVEIHWGGGAHTPFPDHVIFPIIEILSSFAQSIDDFFSVSYFQVNLKV